MPNYGTSVQDAGIVFDPSKAYGTYEHDDWNNIDNLVGYRMHGPNGSEYYFDAGGNYQQTYTPPPVTNNSGGIFGGLVDAVSGIGNAISGEVSHIGDVIATDPVAKTVAAVGVGVLTAGAGTALGASLMDAGIVSSTAAANAVGTAIVNAGLSAAQGVPLDQALEKGALSVLTSQVIAPEVAAEVKTVIDNPVVQSMATNAGTSMVTGALQGQPIDQITKSAIGSATGALAGAAGQEVGSQVLSNIDDPTIAKIAADAASAGTGAAIMGKDVGQAALNAGATTAAHSDLGGYDMAGALPSIDLSGIKEAIQPISNALTSVAQPVSDVATQVLQPLEQPIKNVAQAGSDAATQVLQPLEQPIKNIAQAGSDAATSVLQPLEQPIKDVAQAGSDAVTSVLQPVSDAVSNLPSVNLPNITLPKIGALPTTTAAATPAATPTATTAATPYTPTSPWLDSTPQMLKAATVNQQTPAHMAQLQQLYQSLTPEMQDAFAMHGIQAPETAAHGGHIGHYATGGTSDMQSVMDSMMPKFAKAPTVLEAAPVVSQQSRLGVLKPLRSGLSGQSQASGLAAGGLPHKYAEAAPEGHKPEFITGVTGYYAQGGGTGQSDDIPAMLHDGDYVIDAEAVSALGDGSSKAGAEALAKFQSQFSHHDTGPEKGKPVPAKIADGEYVFPAAFVTALGGGDNKKGAKLLDDMRVELRMHKRAAPTSKIPPKAESPLDYLKMAKG